MLKVWGAFSVLAIGLAGGTPAKGQAANSLVGCWMAMTQPSKITFIVRDGDTVRYENQPAYPVTCCFKLDGTGFTQWGNSSASTFTYRFVNSGVVEFRGSLEKKASRASFLVKGHTLSFQEYPAPKHDREEIALQYILKFTKQP